MSRSKRSTWNYLSSLVLSVVTLVVGLVATRLLVSWLGEERLGAYRIVTDWAGYLGLLDAGLGVALMSMIASAINTGAEEKLAGAMSSGFHGYRIIAGLDLIGGAILIALIPHLVSGGWEISTDLRLAMAILMVGVLFLPMSTLRPLWEADQRAYVITILLLGQSLLMTACFLIFARLKWGVSGQALGATIGMAVYNLALLEQTRRRHPKLIRWFFTPPPLEDRAKLWALNWPTLAQSIAGRLSLLTDNIVIGYFLGPAAVVPFFITQRLPQVAYGQVAGIGNATWAGMVHVLQTDGSAVFNQRLRELTQLIIILGLAALLPIVAYNAHFVELWMPRKNLYGGDVLTGLAALNAVLLSVFAFWGWMFAATGRVREPLNLFIISTIVNVIASAGATMMLKHHSDAAALVGPVLGTSVALVTCHTWWFPLLMRRAFDMPLRPMLIACIKPVIVDLLPGTAMVYLSHCFPPHQWAILLWEMGAWGLLLLGLSWLLVLQPEQRQVWSDRIARGSPLLGRLGRKRAIIAETEAVIERPIGRL